jgi:hypothetical protein
MDSSLEGPFDDFFIAAGPALTISALNVFSRLPIGLEVGRRSLF